MADPSFSLGPDRKRIGQVGRAARTNTGRIPNILGPSGQSRANILNGNRIGDRNLILIENSLPRPPCFKFQVLAIQEIPERPVSH